jgi:hypothetical protein
MPNFWLKSNEICGCSLWRGHVNMRTMAHTKHPANCTACVEFLNSLPKPTPHNNHSLFGLPAAGSNNKRHSPSRHLQYATPRRLGQGPRRGREAARVKPRVLYADEHGGRIETRVYACGDVNFRDIWEVRDFGLPTQNATFVSIALANMTVVRLTRDKQPTEDICSSRPIIVGFANARAKSFHAV